jgi:hypothetical protein
MKRVVFRIDKQGNVKIESLEGYGSNCQSFTELLEKSLGTPDETSREYTGEYYQSSVDDRTNLDAST